MNWQHLIYFKAIVETQSFTRAAEQLYVTPSTLSKAIRALEDEIGFALFKKDGRASVLTEHGATFKTYVDQAIECIDTGVRVIQKETKQFTGRVNLSGIYTICSDYLPPILSRFVASHKQVTFSVLYQITSTILESVQNKLSDLGFCGEYDINSKQYADIERQLLYQEEMVIITPRSHSLASDKYVSFEKLKNEHFIIYKNVNSGTTQLFWDLCNQANITPHIAFEVPDDHTIIGLVSAGMGIALMPNNPSLNLSNVHVLHFPHDPPKRNLYMVWKKDRPLSLAAQAFRDFVLESVEPLNASLEDSHGYFS